MSLDRSAVENVARLARLSVREAEVDGYADQLGRIMELVDDLQSVDTQGVAPMAHPLDATQRLRADEAQAGNQREEFQAQAPSVEDGLFLVPRVIE